MDSALSAILCEKNVCFTGPRPSKLPGNGDIGDTAIKKITSAVSQEIQFAAKQGKVNFLSGLMAGFDVLAAEQVLLLKKQPEYQNIHCILIGPFKQGFFSTKYWTADWVKRAKALCDAADFGITLFEKYHPGVYYERNHFLVANTSRVICYYNGVSGGGTGYTIDLACKVKVEVYNIYGSLL